MRELEVKMYVMWMLLKEDVKSFFKEENGDVNIVSIVVLIGIAVALAVFFRGKVGDLLKDLFKNITTNAENAVNGQVN